MKGRNAAAPTTWLMGMPATWRAAIRWAVLNLSGSYRATFNTAVPHTRQAADPFHVAKLANSALGDVRHRVHNETLGAAAASTTRCTGPASC